MTLAQLRAELQARGFDYLSSARCLIFLNDAYHAICEWEGVQWPFLETTTTGTAPLTISDLREIMYVVDTTTLDRLEQAEVRDIVDLDVSVTTTGTPQRYWLDGLTTLKLWPTNTTQSLSVRYIKVPTDLSGDSDTPVIPTRFHPRIVDQAEIFAFQDAADYANAEAKGAQLAVQMERMKTALLLRAADDPDYIVVTNHDLTGWTGSWW